MGDYLLETSQVAKQYQDLAQKLKDIPKTIQYYPWIRYADDDQGTNMSALPAGKKYMAVVYSNKSSVPSDNPADYAGKWALIQGADGADGVPGAKGARYPVAMAKSTLARIATSQKLTALIRLITIGHFLKDLMVQLVLKVLKDHRALKAFKVFPEAKTCLIHMYNCRPQ